MARTHDDLTSREQALGHAEAVRASKALLDEVHRDRSHRPHVVAELNQQINIGLKLGEVYALLDVADAIREGHLAPVQRDYASCAFTRCVLEADHGGPCLIEHEGGDA